MSKKPTLTEQVAALTQVVSALVAGQHSTTTTVAEAVTAAAPVVAAKPVPVKTASDLLKEHVESKNLAFARGGRTVLTTQALEAAVRVLRTGTPEILPVSERLEKRNVVGLAIGRDGATVITQYVYDPSASE